MNSKELTNFVNVKDFRKNSILYFTNKMKLKLKYIKLLIYICLVLYFIDLIMIIIFPYIFYHIINILAILSKVFSLIFIFFSLKNKIENISKLEYKLLKQIIIIESIVSIIFYIDLFYIVIHNIIHMNKMFLKIFERSIAEITILIFSIIIYILINFIIPLNLLTKIIDLKYNILEIDYEKEKKDYKKIRISDETSRSEFFHNP